MVDNVGTLIGRRLELAELTAALDDLHEGRGGLILLTGDAGIGKTRLLETLADTAEPTDATVLWGRCWEGGGAPAYWPWSQVLRAALMGESDAYPAGVVRYVSELVPELAHGDEPARAASNRDLPGARTALFDAVGTVLRMQSGERPLILAFEDLHAADEASLPLLQFAAKRLRPFPVLILGTYRDAEVRSSPKLHQLLSAIARHGRLMMLTGLDEEGVAKLLAHTTRGVRLAADARTVHGTTEGNPFFVQEAARLLLAERQPALDAARSPRIPVPEEVHDLIRRRLLPLPAEAHDALQLASVLGRDFDVGVLSLLADRPLDELLDILDVGAELTVVQRRELGRWRFSHALLREALYDELEPRQRAKLHRRAGEAIEEYAGEDLAGRAPQLACHFFEAARPGDGARAVQYCAMAARQAMAVMAFEEAAVLNGRALEALALGRSVDEGLRYELLMALALALALALAQAQHQAGDFPSARQTFQRAVNSARSPGSPDLLAKAAIAYTGFAEAKADHTRAGLIEEALAALPPGDSPLRARWDWHSSASLHHDTLRERFAVTDELVEMAVASGDRNRLVLARQWRAADYFPAGDVAAGAVELDVARRGGKASGCRSSSGG